MDEMIPNTRRKNYIGKVYKSKLFGKYEVIQEMIPVGYRSKERLFKIRFFNTGYTYVTQKTAILNGDVRDRYAITVRNVGYLGDRDYIMTVDPLYLYYIKIWDSLIDRCYNPTCEYYCYYGGIGVTVSEEWKCFRTFYYDVKTLPGYAEHLANPQGYRINKDILQKDIDPSLRIYSKETCVWSTKFEESFLMKILNAMYNT